MVEHLSEPSLIRLASLGAHRTSRRIPRTKRACGDVAHDVNVTVIAAATHASYAVHSEANELRQLAGLCLACVDRIDECRRIYMSE